MDDYFSGKLLYGDDFSEDEIANWLKDEAEGYANLGAQEKCTYAYSYHELNNFHGFRHLNGKKFHEVLGLGSAYGDELKPIINHINKITILDPSDAFSDAKAVLDTPCVYVKPIPSGDMPFPTSQFDLITCLGVLHHIPNVSHIIKECSRCLTNGGIMLLREPIISMGDWRKPRKGLTKRERGIPLELLDEIVSTAEFSILHKSLCIFPPIPKIANKLGISAYNNYALTVADSLLSQIFSSKIKYHRTKIIEKFGPSSAYYVLQKP